MNAKWTPNGHQMDTKWTHNGHEMDYNGRQLDADVQLSMDFKLIVIRYSTDTKHRAILFILAGAERAALPAALPLRSLDRLETF